MPTPTGPRRGILDPVLQLLQARFAFTSASSTARPMRCTSARSPARCRWPPEGRVNAQRLGSSISGDSEVAGALRSRLPRLPMRSFFTRLQNPELLTPSASDCAARRPLTKSEEEETIIINRPGRSTYPDEKSVLTSGATPDLRSCCSCTVSISTSISSISFSDRKSSGPNDARMLLLLIGR